MRVTRKPVLYLALLGVSIAGIAQSKKSGSAPVAKASRYFQLTLNLKFAPVADHEPTAQTITTEVAVREGRPGSCKARMISQVPTGTGSGTKYIELGTKLDCNDVHIEGDGIALEFTLETSRIAGMVKTKGSDGVVIDEPVISQRSVQLTARLPLGSPKVVFDFEFHPRPLKAPNPLGDAPASGVNEAPTPQRIDSPLLIEMTATELE